MIFLINYINSINNQKGIKKIKFKNKTFKLIGTEINSISKYEFTYLYNSKKFEEIKKKNYFNSIKDLRDLLSHYLDYEIINDNVVVKKIRIKKFYLINDELILIIKESERDYLILLAISFEEILKSINDYVQEDLNNKVN